jgi:hypothetical protein
MATIALTFLAVFIASVHGDSTCKIAHCKCSFSSIEILRKYIDERIVAATIDKVIAIAMDEYNNHAVLLVLSQQCGHLWIRLLLVQEELLSKMALLIAFKS